MNQSLTRNAVYSIFYRILSVVFPLISVAYVSRILAPEGIGKTAYAQNIASYFVMLAAMGIPAYGTREIAKCREDTLAVNRLFSELFALNFLSTVVISGAYLVCIFSAFSREIWLYLAVGLEVFLNICNVDWFYQGEEAFGYITLRSILVKAVSLVCLFLLIKSSDDYGVYALISCIGNCGNYLFNMIYIRRRVRFSLRGLNLRRHLKSVFVLTLVLAVSCLYSKVDVTMLGCLCGDDAVGYYAMSHKVVMVVLALVTGVTAVFLPRLSHVYEKDRDAFQQYLTGGLKGVLLLVVPGCFGLVAVSENLIHVLLGYQFAEAVRTMQVLSAIIIIRGAGDLLCYQALISAEKEKMLVGSRIVAALTNIVLNFVLIPRYSHTGAALASVLSELVVNGILLKRALSFVEVKLSRHFLLTLLTGTGIMILAAGTVQRVLGISLLSLLAAVLVGAVMYATALLILKNEMLLDICRAMKRRISEL